jgi:Spy/CpxP family protein refolding chaperone
LGLTEDQIAAIKKLQDELRPMGGRGGGGRPGGNGQRGQRPNNPDVRVDGPDRFFVQAQGQRAQPSEEDIRKFREQAQERAKKEREELAKILKPEQAKRLMEIYTQQAGTSALGDADVAKEVGVSDEQKGKMDKIRQEAMAGMRDLFGGGDREAARTKLAEMRKSTDEKVLAVLSDEQKKKFEDLKGKKFDMPEQPRGGRPGGNRQQN